MALYQKCCPIFSSLIHEGGGYTEPYDTAADDQMIDRCRRGFEWINLAKKFGSGYRHA